MMDCNIHKKWKLLWEEEAENKNVELIVLDSYIQLLEHVVTNVQYPTGVVAVIYINGCLRFSERYCKDPTACKNAAIQFWKWCECNVVNPPVNFLNISIVPISGCSSWNDLATIHSESGMYKKKALALGSN